MPLNSKGRKIMESMVRWLDLSVTKRQELKRRCRERLKYEALLREKLTPPE